jgi:hypothetical protein
VFSAIVAYDLHESLSIERRFVLAYSLYCGKGGQRLGVIARHLLESPVPEDDIGREVLLICELLAQSAQPFKKDGVIG